MKEILYAPSRFILLLGAPQFFLDSRVFSISWAVSHLHLLFILLLMVAFIFQLLRCVTTASRNLSQPEFSWKMETQVQTEKKPVEIVVQIYFGSSIYLHNKHVEK